MALAALIASLVAAGHAGADWLEARQRSAIARELLAAAHIDPNADFHTTIDAIRTFINDHSEHNMDAEFYAVWGNFAAMANGVLTHASGHSSKRQHAECSTRSEMMRAMLQELGLETRVVYLYGDDLTASHTMLGVRNPQTGQWETQDPAYDIYWRHALGARASIVDVAAAPDSFVPCGRKKCGWDHASRERIEANDIRRRLLAFVAVDEDGGSRRYSFYAVGVDPARAITWRDNTGTFCEVIPKRCRQGFASISERTAQTYIAMPRSVASETPRLVADGNLAQ